MGILNNLFGNSNSSNGLLPPEYQNSSQQRGLLGLAQGLLSASGPSRIPVSFGQALGQGLQGMQGAQDDYLNTLVKAKTLNDSGLSEFDKVVRTYQSLPDNDPRKKMYSDRIEKETTPMSLFGPVAGVDPKTGQPVFGTKQDALSGKIQPPNATQKFTPEQAGKISMARNALAAANEVKTRLFNPDGSIDTKKLLAANLNIPGTEGRQIRNLMKNAIEAQLRLESGAAVPESEVTRALDRFMPSPFDNDSTKAQKIQQLQNLLGGTLAASGANPEMQGQPPTAPQVQAPQISPDDALAELRRRGKIK